jgi:catechol 2,3-dioxygenase-like lactoylglutathione lyase family enzyme
MTIQRMDNVAIVVDDLDAAIDFFTELGMELEGKGQIEGLWADHTVGLDGVRSTHGAELLGQVAQYENIYRLCYLRGPAGIIVALAEQID